jgi:serine protease Do
MRSNIFSFLKTATLFTFLIVSMQIESGCSGCSPSGRRGNQKTESNKPSTTNSVERKSSTSRESQRTTASKQILPLNELYNMYKKSVFLVYTSDGNNGFQGTGFFISKNGLAVSNYHVFEGTSQGLEVIETIDGAQFKILKVLDKSKENDYIVFQVNIDSYKILNPISIVSQLPQVGEDVFAIGNPRGLESTLSKGIVSGFRENNTLIQTTTEITHGSSGGPLLNMRGEVVGITSAGLGEANLNFAVNIKLLNLNRFK